MQQVLLEVPDRASETVGEARETFGRRIYETAVVKWFDEGRISQGQAAELLGICRGELFDLLWEHKVSPIQITPEELAEEMRSV